VVDRAKAQPRKTEAFVIQRILLSVVVLLSLISLALGESNMSSEITSTGKLRVGMIAITVLGGVADPVARFIGSRLGLPVEPVMYPSPGAYAQSFGKDEWDIAIGPRALAPDGKADSTADIWTISLVYVAAPD
jgi:ABC-type phosphate/phosphonate transport system substrate-binding protein